MSTSFRPRAYPGYAVPISTGLSPERLLKMQVLYEPNWTAGGWESARQNVTNYSDWLRDSSDAGTDSDESIPRYMSVPPTNHYQQIDVNPQRPIVLDVIQQDAWAGPERLWAESTTERLKTPSEKKRVQRSQSCRTKGSKLSQLVHRNGGHDPHLKPDPMYENLTTRDPWSVPENLPDKASNRNSGFATVRQPLKQSKSMRSLKDVSWSPDGETAVPKPNLKHSKSLRSLKNRGSRTSSEDSSKSNTLRRFLKFPDILRSSGSGKNEWDDMKPISSLKPAVSLNGFENPAIYVNPAEDAEQRLSRLLVNSQPFASVSQSRRESPVYEEPCYVNNEPEELYANIIPQDVEHAVNDFYEKKGSRSIFKNLTLRLKKKMSFKSSNKPDEYKRAGVYDVPVRSFIHPQPEDADDFAIPRPKLIVPVHTYGIRKRRTGNTQQSARTRSDATSSADCCLDSKKTHHSCPGKFINKIPVSFLSWRRSNHDDGLIDRLILFLSSLSD